MLKEKNGITLISLVITIVLLLILAGVAINLTVDSDGIFGKSGEAANKWNTAISKDEQQLEGLLQTLGQFDTPWSEDVAEGFKEGDGTEATPYLIENGQQLSYLAQQVNNGVTFEGKYIKLTDDIDLEYRPWTPIGKSSNKFKGNFDGNNKVISNLQADLPNESGIGLFGYAENGQIENLTINNAIVKGRTKVGAVGGSLMGTKLTEVNLVGSIMVEGLEYVGGIVGWSYTKNWENLTITAEKGSYVKGDPVAYGYNYFAYVGGILGFTGEGYGDAIITNATSNIDVIGTVSSAGGIVGIGNYNNTFINCSSSGNVTLTAAESELLLAIGGIAGMWVDKDGTSVTFTNCSFTGQLSSEDVDGNAATEFENNGLVGIERYGTATTAELIIN